MYDVLVIGAGHAGCEAALAAARMGAKTALITMDPTAAGRMSCNPSIGGMAKSHIVFELDALGGEMARNTDYTGIQFRVLNTRKGPSVRAHRAQCDKNAYSRRMHFILEETDNLRIIQAEATGIHVKNDKIEGILIKSGDEIYSKTVVVTAGTFLNGKIYIGKKIFAGGRIGENSADELAACITDIGFRTERLKTGTPPRLKKDSLDYSKMEIQPGEVPPPFFSWEARKDWDMFHVEQSHSNDKTKENLFHVEQSGSVKKPWIPGTDQIPCYLTHTNLETHGIIQENLSKSALYGGLIGGTGVRYCPSIEDKIVKFRNQSRHHVFIEPEGRDTVSMYPNGTSNSLPEDIQLSMIHSIRGMEYAEFLLPGYAIEYDFYDPTQLKHSLETKLIENLFFAGQINGTTGYEEAAGQGFVAGINAALKVRGDPPVVFSRNESYIGVLIDDLVTKGTNEPYRMFTSRAEHRLLLRQDNARFRLNRLASLLSIVGKDVTNAISNEICQIETEIIRLEREFMDGISMAQLLRRPAVSYRELPAARKDLSPSVIEQVEINVKYAGYIERERQQVARFEHIARQLIPSDIDYDAITALRFETREKLKRILPENLGQASRISGVTPADIAILSVWLS